MKKYILPFVVLTICFIVFEVNDSDTDLVLKANNTTCTNKNYQVAHNDNATTSTYSYSDDEESNIDNLRIVEIR